MDRSLTTLWYPGDWSEIGDDELVYLLPSLGTRRPERDEAGVRGRGPIRYLTQTLTARALAAADLIASESRGSLTASQALERLVGNAILTSIPLDELTVPAPESCRAPRLPSRGGSAAARAEDFPDWLALELSALAHLDRLLRDARGPEHGALPPPLVDWPLTLADAVFVTINARLNAAYVHSQLTHAHELLTAVAILGHLASGRAAYLPPGIAQSLADLISGRPTVTASEGETKQCVAIGRLYADLAGGAEQLIGIVRRAAASGRPSLVRPRRATMPSDTGRHTWNAHLLRRISERWHVSA